MAEANRVSSRSVGDHRDVLGLGKGSVSKDMAKAIWVGSRSCGVPRVGKGFLLVPSFSFSFLGLSRKLFLWLPTHAPVEGSQISKGSYSSIFIDREAYLRPPVLFTQVTAIPSDSDGSPIMSSLSLIVSDVGHQGSFEGRFDYLLRRNGRQNPGPGRPQSPPRLHLVFSE